MNACIRALTAAMVVGTAGIVFAQAAPSRQGASAEAPKDAGAILDASRQAVAKVRSLSYAAKVSGEGSLAGKVPSHTAEVSASRAEAGGWKLAAKGAQSGGEGSKPVAFEIGYDGVTARALHEDDKMINEKTVQEWNDLPTFFATQSARPVVAWEMLDEKAMDAGKEGPKYIGQEKIAGETCDVVMVGTEADHGTKYYLSQADHLPRRIDRFESAAEGAAPGVRRLELSNLKLDEKSVAGAYTISAPEGYAIRVAKRERPAAKGGGEPGQKLGDPDDTRGHLAKRGQVNEGDMAPAFDLKDPSGKSVTLESLKGKVVVIDFWGTWCPWCVKAMPQVQKVHEKFQGKDVVVLGFDVDAPGAKPVEFMKRNKLTYTTLLNADDAAKDFKVSGFPTLFVLDQTGKVIMKEEGFSPNLFESVSKAIDGALAK
ncbi:MAG: TlpA disulfide reductase family protein [Phycisphaerales bacterium]|jgi:thiol-disulfide isomerase/thioredoxin